MGEGHDGDRGVQDLHESGQHHRRGDEPGVRARTPLPRAATPGVGGCRGRHLTFTSGSTDMPGRSIRSTSWPFPKTILTGTLCTTFT